MQLASALQVLAGVPLDTSGSLFRERAESALSNVAAPQNQWQRVMSQGLLLTAALRRLGIDTEGVLRTSFGDNATRLTQSRTTDERQSRVRTIAQQACAIIDTEYCCRLTVLSLSRRLHVHRNRLSAEFFSAYHHSIPDYIARMRVIRSAALLRADRMALLDVANTVGYRSKKDFCRQFRHVMGMTPGQFRRSVTLSDSKTDPTCATAVLSSKLVAP